jgi:hypothetical protein
MILQNNGKCSIPVSDLRNVVNKSGKMFLNFIIKIITLQYK